MKTSSRSRSFVAAGAALITLTSITACGGSDNPDSTNSASSSESADATATTAAPTATEATQEEATQVAAATTAVTPAPDQAATSLAESTDTSAETSEAAYPVTIDHLFGSTTIEQRPERIVSLSIQWTDAAIALGQPPIGYVLDAASGESEPYPWSADELTQATRIDATAGIPYEQIAALEPDLILVTFAATDQATYDTLSAIAPTIGPLGDLQIDPWQDQIQVLGEVLSETEQARAAIDQVDQQVADLAAELPGLKGKTYAAANYVPGDSIYVIADPDDGSSELFYDLGMEIDPKILAVDTEVVGRVSISFEQIGVLDADLIGVLANGADLNEIPGWDQLRAVADGAVIEWEYVDAVALNTPSVLSIPWVLDRLRPVLEATAT